jgi:hypothetical protein
MADDESKVPTLAGAVAQLALDTVKALIAEGDTLRAEVGRLRDAMNLCSGSCHSALAAPSGAQGEMVGVGGTLKASDWTKMAREAGAVPVEWGKHPTPDFSRGYDAGYSAAVGDHPAWTQPTPSPAAEVTGEIRGALDQIRQECATLRRRPQQGHVCDYRKAIDRFHDVAAAAIRAMGKA